MATESIHTYCAMCVSRCGVVATVEDGRFAKVSVDPQHPNGCICIKGTAAPDIVYSPDRLRQPMVRTRAKGDRDPGWKEISWDDAMTLAAARLAAIRDRDGPEAVVFGRATPAGGSTVDIEPWVQRLANSFGSPNILTTTHICTWNRYFGAKNTYGVLTPTPDVENANCILLWGTNPQACEPAMAANISHARRRGAKLIVIDPRQHALAAKADCWLRVRPGSDAALAMAMIHVLFEEGLYDEAFVRDWTNGPFLVREDTLRLLTARDLSGSAAGETFVVWDRGQNGPAPWRAGQGCAQAHVQPELYGRFECRMADGGPVVCRTVLDLLREQASRYAPERSSDVTWVPPEQVRRAVRLFTREGPSAYATWTGLEQHSNALQINRAVACYYALTGQFDTRGSNVSLVPTPSRPVTGEALLPPEQRRRRLGITEFPLGPPNDPGNVQANTVCDAIIDRRPYPVRAMVLFGSDLLLGHGDPQRSKQALEALDFYVHIDFFENPSARFADLLLPACTPWECEAVRPFFPGTAKTVAWSQLRKAVVQPQHGSRPDLDIIFDLALRLGLREHFYEGDIEAAWNDQLAPAGLTVQQLRDHPAGIGSEQRTHYRKYAAINPKTGNPNGFSTPSGRIELYSTRLAQAGYPPLPDHTEPAESPLAAAASDYPLVLTAFRSINYCDQQHRNIPRLRRGVPHPVIELHPDVAAKLDIKDGDWACVETRQGRAKLKATYNAALHPGVVCAPYGWWQECKELGLSGYDALSPDGANVNLLIPNDDIDPISASVPHRSRMCRITRLNNSG